MYTPWENSYPNAKQKLNGKMTVNNFEPNCRADLSGARRGNISFESIVWLKRESFDC